jgi:hypothetical protein
MCRPPLAPVRLPDVFSRFGTGKSGARTSTGRRCRQPLEFGFLTICLVKRRKHPVKAAAGSFVECNLSGRLVGPDVELAPIPGQELI